ncbi:hypothetical protein EUX98_g9174 [Antrodiella citrinella]|uniref:Uncharacterized protein n=1 Tax=Antrodiella citrinella TaxID=2447956 RepID=A0A4S4LYL8_9APHY|nr:hypothetical protein EUX98_g9174 [Antrodiella citrinella]
MIDCDERLLQKAGQKTGENVPIPHSNSLHTESIISFSNPPLGSDLPPALSAPVGLRGILAEVRASQMSRPPMPRPTKQPQEILPSEGDNENSAPGQSGTTSSGQGKGAPSRGYVGGRSAQITTFAWLSSVKVGKREDSSGPGSGGESTTVSRMHSRSRPPSLSVDHLPAGILELRKGVEARERTEDDHKDGDGNQSLQDEITSVVNKLTSSKVRLEKADLTKRRTCTFGLHGPWGEATSVFIRQLVCFFRAPPRIVRNLMRDLSASPSIGSRGPDQAPRLFRSPALLSDAVRRLSLAASDRDIDLPETKRTEDAHSILRIMSNLYSFSHQRVRKFSENSRPSEDVPTNYSLLPTRRSTVFIRDASAILGLDIASAAQYVFPSTHPRNWCATNAEIARHAGRVYHQRVFTMLQVMILDSANQGADEKERLELTPLLMKLVEKLYLELLAHKDIQMLSIMAIMLFDLMSTNASCSCNVITIFCPWLLVESVHNQQYAPPHVWYAEGRRASSWQTSVQRPVSEFQFPVTTVWESDI